jgi:flavin-dependent dehydrogenase
MTRCDALVVGGGPGGSSCAHALRRAGWDVVVADRARYPRDKVCAGWLTPRVLSLLDLDPAAYRGTGRVLQEITGFRTGVIDRPADLLVRTEYPRVVSYAIRRCEFDHFLLERAGVRVLEGTQITSLRRNSGAWVVNDSIETQIVIGAGGHFCPVARHLRGGADTSSPVVAKEAEFLIDDGDEGGVDPTPALFFCRDMEGYGWSVRKGGYLNVGIGRRVNEGFNGHLERFVAFLEANGILPGGATLRWRGHAYFAAGVGPRPLVDRGIVLIGDAAGLAYPESGEGILPAIESGLLAAKTLIAANGRSGIDDLQPYADAVGRLHPPAPPRAAPVRTAFAALGRLLLRSPAFTRHVVLDRWFLRMQPSLDGAASPGRN